MKFPCAHCGKIADRPTGHINRSRAQGLKLYCGRRCSALGRRRGKTKAQRVAEKRQYDMEYRRHNRAMLKAKKAEHFRRTYDPVAARIERKKRMAFHVEYCRRPSYKFWKREYDRRRRANQYGPFADAYTLMLDLNREISTRMSNYEIKRQNVTFGKKQARAREGSEKATRDRRRSP